MFNDEVSSLFSLLGLLEPSEYFITVDHSALWHKHISWAKSGGADLRSYITQRYASSMVFLSCLLAAQVRKEVTEVIVTALLIDLNCFSFLDSDQRVFQFLQRNH